MNRFLPTLRFLLVVAGGLFYGGAGVNAEEIDPFAGRWSSFGAGPSHSGFYPVTIGDVTVIPGWTKSFDGQPISQVAIADGRVVVTANAYPQSRYPPSPDKPFLAALNSSTGEELWRYQSPKYYFGAPTISSTCVFLQTSETFTTLNVADGSVVWERPIASFSIFPAPVSLGDRVWAASTNGVYSLRISDNSIRYFTRAPQPYYGTSLSYYEGVLYGMDARNFLALDPDTGVRLWMLPLSQDGSGVGQSAVAQNKAALITGNRLVILDLTTRSQLWSVVGLFSQNTANDGSTIYAIAGYYQNALNAYDAQTGQLRGHYDIPSSFDESLPHNFQPLVTNDLVMIATNKATYIYDKATFQLRTKLNVGGYLSFCGGVLYVADDWGNLSTFKFATAQGEPVPGPWPAATPVPVPLVPNSVELVTTNYQGSASANNFSSLSALSAADGRYVLFGSSATDLTPIPDGNNQFDLFRRDRWTGITELVTVNYAGTAASGPANSSVGMSSITPDGRFVVFTAYRTDLVPEGGPGSLFVRDMVAGKTSLVSISLDGKPRQATAPQISADGRYVVFGSSAQDLVPGHSAGPPSDVYVRDMVANTTQLVSVDGGERGQGAAGAITMTRDGRYVLYWTAPTNSLESRQLFLRDIYTGGKAQITLNTSGRNPKDGTFEPTTARVSEDGRFVFFDSTSTDLVTNDTGAHTDVFIRDVAAGATLRLGVWDPIADNRLCDISADGQVVAFNTYSDNGNEINIYDRRKGTIEPLSPAAPGVSGGSAAKMDRTGRFVVFEGDEGSSIGFNNDNNHTSDIFVIDRQLHTARLLSHNLSGSSGNGASMIHFAQGPVISDDGQTVVFESRATDLTSIPVVPVSQFSTSLSVFAASVPSSGRLLNISTRADVLSSDNALIAGFVLSGADPKKVIIRAIGPSLGNAGVTGVLNDPTLELYDGAGSLLASNDNWKENAAEVSETGAAPTHELESALVRVLQPGAYTAVVRGKSGASGIGLVELYDLGQSGDSTLANISTRGFIHGGDNVLIAGFIVGGDGGGASRVLIRGMGPSLAGFGVSDALPDPVLDLYDSNGSRVKTNDDWKQTERGEIQATGIVPPDDAESAILYTLAPGSYTTIVGGKGASGVGLVEVYNLR